MKKKEFFEAEDHIFHILKTNVFWVELNNIAVVITAKGIGDNFVVDFCNKKTEFWDAINAHKTVYWCATGVLKDGIYSIIDDNGRAEVLPDHKENIPGISDAQNKEILGLSNELFVEREHR